MRGLARGDHRARVLAQIAFETSTGQQSGVFTIARDEHLGARLGVGRPAGADDRGQHQWLIGQAGALKQRE